MGCDLYCPEISGGLQAFSHTLKNKIRKALYHTFSYEPIKPYFDFRREIIDNSACFCVMISEMKKTELYHEMTVAGFLEIIAAVRINLKVFHPFDPIMF